MGSMSILKYPVRAGDQVHWDKLWGVVEGHALPAVDEVISDVRELMVGDLGGSTAVGVIIDVG